MGGRNDQIVTKERGVEKRETLLSAMKEHVLSIPIFCIRALWQILIQELSDKEQEDRLVIGWAVCS